MMKGAWQQPSHSKVVQQRRPRRPPGQPTRHARLRCSPGEEIVWKRSMGQRWTYIVVYVRIKEVRGFDAHHTSSMLVSSLMLGRARSISICSSSAADMPSSLAWEGHTRRRCRRCLLGVCVHCLGRATSFKERLTQLTTWPRRRSPSSIYRVADRIF